MNKQQRKALEAHLTTFNELREALAAMLDGLRADPVVRPDRTAVEAVCAELESFAEILGDAYDEESEKYDNMPESLQNGDRGERMAEARDALERAKDAVEEALQQLENIKPIEWVEMNPIELASEVESAIDELETADSEVSDAVNS